MPGWRQRLAAVDRDRSRSPRNHESTFLGLGFQLLQWLRDWGWGSLFATDIVKNASTKLKDDKTTKNVHIRRLARCMRNPNNAERVVGSIIPQNLLISPVSLEDSKIDTVLLPYDTFHWLQEMNPRKFNIHMGAKPGGIAHWWAELASSEEGQDMWRLHPWLRNKTPEQLRFHLPLVLFDDAGPVSDSQSSYARCYYSILGPGSEKETRIIMATGFKTPGVDKSWGPILESFEKLARDVPPGKWGGMLLFGGSDLEYVCNELGMRHYNSAQICGYCEGDCDDSKNPHTDYSAGANWRVTIRNNAEFLAAFRQPLHPLVEHAVYSKYFYRFDLMHMMDHHGISSHIAANVIIIHIRDRSGLLTGSTIDARLDFLNNDIAAYYSFSGVRSRMAPLRQSNLTDATGYPELHGPLIKAANTRALIPYLLNLQERATRAWPTTQNRHMLKVVQSLQTLYDVFYGAGYFLTQEEKVLVAKHCNRLGMNYQVLAVAAMRAGSKLWKQTAKLHYCVGHLPDQSRLINPRYVQGYTSESMVGSMKEIYVKSMSGPHHKVVQHKFAHKYCTGLLLDWHPEAIM